MVGHEHYAKIALAYFRKFEKLEQQENIDEKREKKRRKSGNVNNGLYRGFAMVHQ